MLFIAFYKCPADVQFIVKSKIYVINKENGDVHVACIISVPYNF
jgi:hypothetical protein